MKTSSSIKAMDQKIKQAQDRDKVRLAFLIYNKNPVRVVSTSSKWDQETQVNNYVPERTR